MAKTLAEGRKPGGGRKKKYFTEEEAKEKQRVYSKGFYERNKEEMREIGKRSSRFRYFVKKFMAIETTIFD